MDRSDRVEQDRQDREVREAARERAFDHTPSPRLTDAEWDAKVAALHEQIRVMDPALADAMDAEERGERSLTDDERARLDALLTGTGYVVGGRRVDPAIVSVYRPKVEADFALIPLHELPVQGGSWGMGLWARVRAPDDPLWAGLDDRQRRMWGQAERFVAHHEQQRRKPGPLRFEMAPGEPVSEYERRVEAVEAALARGLARLILSVGPVRVQAHEEWLHETAEAVLAAAETGI